jgi:hypothetical protein
MGWGKPCGFAPFIFLTSNPVEEPKYRCMAAALQRPYNDIWVLQPDLM